MSTLNGVFVAMVTPFIGDIINRDAIARLLEFYKLKGLYGVLVCGSTGESHLMTKDEIKETIEAVVNFASGNLKIIAGIVRSSTRDAIEIAKFSQDVGADAVLAITPYYYKFKEEEIIDHYNMLRKSVEIPVLLYNAPVFTGYNVSPEIVAKMLNEGIIDGIKDTVVDVDHILRILINNERKDVTVFAGSSRIFLPALSMGISGGILASANYVPELAVDVYENWTSKHTRESYEAFRRLVIVSKAIECYGVPGIKAAMGIRGLPAGNPRRPFRELDENKKKMIRIYLSELANIK